MTDLNESNPSFALSGKAIHRNRKIHKLRSYLLLSTVRLEAWAKYMCMTCDLCKNNCSTLSILHTFLGLQSQCSGDASSNQYAILHDCSTAQLSHS